MKGEPKVEHQQQQKQRNLLETMAIAFQENNEKIMIV